MKYKLCTDLSLIMPIMCEAQRTNFFEFYGNSSILYEIQCWITRENGKDVEQIYQKWLRRIRTSTGECLYGMFKLNQHIYVIRAARKYCSTAINIINGCAQDERFENTR